MVTLAIVLSVVVVCLVGIYLFIRFSWFYRNPERVPEDRRRTIISPADGQVVYIKKIDGGEIYSEKLGSPIKLEEIAKFPLDQQTKGWIIGIYMSPFDVHFNYSPIEGKVEKIAYYKAKTNLPMVDLLEYINLAYLRRTFDNFAKRFHLQNERNTLLIKGSEFPVVVVEIADKFVNKISCFVKEGQKVSQAEKIGFIDRGSQVDLIILKEDLDLNVEFGDQVYGGKSVLAKY